MNKRASMMDGILWVVIAFLTLVIFGGLMLMYNSVYSGLMGVGDVGGLNVTNATSIVFGSTMGTLNSSMNIIAFIILAGGAFSILIHNFLVRQHPAWFIVYVIMTIFAVVLSAYVSNYYIDLLSNEVIGSSLQELTMANFIMQWLPYWSAVIGIMGAIFLFIGALRRDDYSGVYQ